MEADSHMQVNVRHPITGAPVGATVSVSDRGELNVVIHGHGHFVSDGHVFREIRFGSEATLNERDAIKAAVWLATRKGTHEVQG